MADGRSLFLIRGAADPEVVRRVRRNGLVVATVVSLDMF
jgi:hypothetical protein